MPPPPHPHPHFLVIFFLLPILSANAHPCSPPPLPTKLSCPPFHSPPPFPFSTAPGCGHPSFQLQCSFPNSIITINNLPFSLLHYDPNSPSLLLSPHPSPFFPKPTNCTSPHFSSIPTKSISLSNSPFQVSDASCSRLSALRPCPPPNLPNCSHCPWHCKLIKNPLQLLHGCGSAHRPISEQGCQGDVLEFLDNFLKWGVEVNWVEDQDTYFSSCKECLAGNGVCGFNESEQNKNFIFFHSMDR